MSKVEKLEEKIISLKEILVYVSCHPALDDEDWLQDIITKVLEDK